MEPFTPDEISDWFWGVIATASRDPDRLYRLLNGMSREDVIRFCAEFEEAAVELTDERFISCMEYGLSEDGIKDVADWVVSQGKEVYSEIWEHPDRIPNSIEVGSNTTFTGVADVIFLDRFDEVIPYVCE